MKKQIYLDNAATTPVLSNVLEKMEPFFVEKFGNPSSIHSVGRRVKIPLEDARDQIASALNTKSSNIIFTSGGTESDFLGITGAALANKEKGKHIIISTIEHSAVNQAAHFLTDLGFEITQLPVNHQGQIEMRQLVDAVREDTILISIMYVNNEIGTIQPIREIGEFASQKGILFHSDAVQAFPILNINLEEIPIDLLTISSHKINGPKGIGALYIREGINFKPLIGGTQERLRRGGTENVPGIVGFGEATRILSKHREDKYKKCSMYKDRMLEIWNKEIGQENYVINGNPNETVPSILNVSFLGIETRTMIMSLDMEHIAVSGGSACASSTKNISRVIKALDVPDEITQSAIRISFGQVNNSDEIEQAALVIAGIVKKKLKEM